MMGELREDIEAIQVLGLRRFLYGRFIYRHHMRWLHRRGKHKLKHYGPMFPDGGEFDKCEWCGHTENIVVGAWAPKDWTSGVAATREAAKANL